MKTKTHRWSISAARRSPLTLAACLLAVFAFGSGAAMAQCAPDLTPPTITCTDITVTLDASGFASLFSASALYSTAAITSIYDRCSGGTGYYPDNEAYFTIEAVPSQFNCNDLDSPVSVAITVSDQAGNSAECVSTVTVTDPLQACVVIEGEGEVLEGEGEVLPEGEGEVLPEGEGEVLPEGEGEVLEGEGEVIPEGEGEIIPEGEGEVIPEGEGEVIPEGEGEVIPEGEGEVIPEGEGEVLPEGEGEVIPEGEGEVAAAAVSLTKTADRASFSAVGEVITYTIVVTNTGTVPLTNVRVQDPLTGLDQTVATLAPGGSRTFTTTYTVTQADLDAGEVLNTAAVSARDPQGLVLQDEAERDVPGEAPCCAGFDIMDPANLFIGGLALLVLIIASVVCSLTGIEMPVKL